MHDRRYYDRKRFKGAYMVDGLPIRNENLRHYRTPEHHEAVYFINKKTLQRKRNEEWQRLRYEIAVCRRRKARRETLFKMGGIGGVGKITPKKIFRKMTQDSKINCTRRK